MRQTRQPAHHDTPERAGGKNDRKSKHGREMSAMAIHAVVTSAFLPDDCSSCTMGNVTAPGTRSDENCQDRRAIEPNQLARERMPATAAITPTVAAIAPPASKARRTSRLWSGKLRVRTMNINKTNPIAARALSTASVGSTHPKPPGPITTPATNRTAHDGGPHRGADANAGPRSSCRQHDRSEPCRSPSTHPMGAADDDEADPRRCDKAPVVARRLLRTPSTPTGLTPRPEVSPRAPEGVRPRSPRAPGGAQPTPSVRPTPRLPTTMRSAPTRRATRRSTSAAWPGSQTGVATERLGQPTRSHAAATIESRSGRWR